MQFRSEQAGVKSHYSGLHILCVDTLVWMDHSTCFEHNSCSMVGWGGGGGGVGDQGSGIGGGGRPDRPSSCFPVLLTLCCAVPCCAVTA